MVLKRGSGEVRFGAPARWPFGEMQSPAVSLTSQSFVYAYVILPLSDPPNGMRPYRGSNRTAG